jgi:predicted SnoaL-like aldol condensation-catalyzing enzyme
MTESAHPHVQTIEQYLERLRNDEYERAAATFASDAVYYHTPMYQDDPKIEGRDDIQAYFERRGHQDIHHEIVKSAVDGDDVGIVGHVTGEDVSGDEDFFVSFAEFDGEQISYYIAGVLGNY